MSPSHTAEAPLLRDRRGAEGKPVVVILFWPQIMSPFQRITILFAEVSTPYRWNAAVVLGFVKAASWALEPNCSKSRLFVKGCAASPTPPACARYQRECLFEPLGSAAAFRTINTSPDVAPPNRSGQSM